MSPPLNTMSGEHKIKVGTGSNCTRSRFMKRVYAPTEVHIHHAPAEVISAKHSATSSKDDIAVSTAFSGEAAPIFSKAFQS